MQTGVLPPRRYLFMLGTPAALFSYIGFEAPAQFAEETKRADRAVPWGIMWSILVTALLGFAYLVVLLFCIQVSHPSHYQLSWLTHQACLNPRQVGFIIYL